MTLARYAQVDTLAWLAAIAIVGAALIALIGFDYLCQTAAYPMPSTMAFDTYVHAADAGQVIAIAVHSDSASVTLTDGTIHLVQGPFQDLERLARTGVSVEYGIVSPRFSLATGYAIGGGLIVIAISIYLRLVRPVVARIRKNAKAKADLARRKPASQQKLWRAAVHEAGHAIAAHAHGFRIESAMIDPILATGAVEYESPELDTRRNFERLVCTLLSGHASEVAMTGTSASGSRDDLQRAGTLVRRLVREYGMGDRTEGMPVSNESSADLVQMAEDDETEFLIAARDGARELINSNRTAIAALAQNLMRVHRMNGTEVHALLAGHLLFGAVAAAPLVVAA